MTRVFFALAFLVCFGGAAAAEEEIPSAKSYTVTSIEKCYAQLSREEALDIQQNYIKPYGECTRRLALKMQKKSAEKPAEEAPVKRDGFYRVQNRTEDKNRPKEPVPEAKAPAQK